MKYRPQRDRSAYPLGQIRTGYTKNHGQPASKVRRKMAQASRKINRQREKQ